MVITSLANATVKLLASLRLDKYRAEHGLFIVEGSRTIAEAHQAGAVPKILVHVENGESLAAIAGVKQACLGAGGTVLAVTPEVMAKITHKQNPQGAAAAYAIPRRGFADIKLSQNDLYVALDRIRDPGNLGTIIRTAHAVKASGVLLIGDACDPYGTESVRATTGSIFHVPLFAGREADFIALAARWPGRVVGAAASAPTHYRKADYKSPVLIVMGAEQSGLSDNVAAACHLLAHLPLYGSAESLNVSVAAGVLLYAVRETLSG